MNSEIPCFWMLSEVSGKKGGTSTPFVASMPMDSQGIDVVCLLHFPHSLIKRLLYRAPAKPDVARRPQAVEGGCAAERLTGVY